MYAIKNLSQNQTFKLDPWTWEGDPAPTKNAWGEPETNYCFYSGYEGLAPGQRISESNPAEEMSWAIADYDQPITDDMLRAALEKANPKPNWSHRTISGGMRLLWQFAEPIRTSSTTLHDAMIGVVAKKLNLKKLLPGWDEQAWKHAGQYYAVGTDWKQHSKAPIAQSTVTAWMIDAGNKVNWKKAGKVSIPIEVIAAEVEKRWPGCWRGEWKFGARGRRFWDSTADNQTAAILRETGVQCFTGEKSFLTWSEILGAAFVRKYEEDRIGQSIGNTYFDGRGYWRQDGANIWRSYDRTNLSTELRVAGLSAAIMRGDTSSEIDRALVHIINERRVEAAGNYVFRPQGVITIKGMQVLNVSRLRPCTPASEKITEWGDRFPYLSQFLDQFFADPVQLDHFLAWLRHAYRGAINQRPSKGQNIFVVGGVNSGKTLLSDFILSTLFGGHYDASDYVTKDSEFANGAFDYFLWTIGDAKPIADGRSKKRFTAALKALAANRDQQVNEKYEKGYMAEYYGRVVITSNDDSESISILPDVNMSNEDKINFYRCAQRKIEFRLDLDQVLNEELPFFASWLLATDHADWIERDIRFGVKSFHDEQLFKLAQAGGDGGLLEELLYSLRKDIPETPLGEWRGTTTELMNRMSSIEGQGAVKDWNVTTVGRAITHLAGSRSYIRKSRNKSNRELIINFKEFVEFFEGDKETPF